MGCAAFRIGRGERQAWRPLALQPSHDYIHLSLEASMESVIWLVDTLFTLYWWVILLTVVMSWLIAFNIVNFSNPYVRQFNVFLRRLTEPVLAPIRRILPDLGGIDISPIILLIALEFIRRFVIGQMIQLL
jgi:YggT family protein